MIYLLIEKKEFTHSVHQVYTYTKNKEKAYKWLNEDSDKRIIKLIGSLEEYEKRKI